MRSAKAGMVRWWQGGLDPHRPLPPSHARAEISIRDGDFGKTLGRLIAARG